MATVNVQELIDSRKLSGFQILVTALCALIVLIDGFDTQAIGYVAPAIVRSWHVDRAELTPVFSAGLFGLMLGGALALYAYGYVADELTYGRSLALVVIVLDVAAGDGVGRVEASFRWGRACGWVRASAVALGALLLVGLITTRSGLVRMVPTRLLPASVRTSAELKRVDEQYGFLSRFVSGKEVVIGTTDEDNRVIPAIAGEPLRPFWKAPGPCDAATRAAAQAEFLDPAIASARRREIRTRFDVHFVLLHTRDRNAPSLTLALESEGATVVYDKDGLRLLALRRARFRDEPHA